MVEYLRESPHTVNYLRRNLGSRAIWILGPPNDFFVYTDPDLLPIEDCPLNAVQRLADVMDTYPAMKVGMGLYLDDLPEDFDPGILAWEQSLVSKSKELEPGVFQSKVDTTFALNRPGSRFALPGIRLGWPFQMRHTSWYCMLDENLSEEDTYYLKHATEGPRGSSWLQVRRGQQLKGR
jgi:hypothetical protein